MFGSDGAVSAARPGRGDRVFAPSADDYQVILPNLPSGRIAANTVFMHGDPRARPYRVEDYRDTLAKLGALDDVLALGAYQMNHVWAVTLTSAEAARKLLSAVDVKVKDRPCLLIDPNNREVRLKLHWLLHGVTDEDVRVALTPYGKVFEVKREKWRAPGITEKGSTTRSVGLKLHSDVKVDDIPHQLKIAGELTLVVVPGRAPLCLRCKSTGHIRRDCRVPRCSRCRRFGHEDADCAKTYASVTGPAQESDALEHLMDEADSEETAGVNPSCAVEDGSSCRQEEGVCEAPGKPDAGLPYEGVGESSEKVDASSTGDTCLGSADETPSEAEPMTGIESDSGTVTGKRPRDEGKKDKGTTAASPDEPPAKTTPARRPTIRPRPNISSERKTAETPPSPT
nr:uncharacterized protein LOC119186796 [Rhipicephalus microplus]